MDAVYYLSMILFIIGLPALLGLIVFTLIKPQFTQKFFKHQWSRKRIGIIGVASLFVGVIVLSGMIDSTMPASVRAEIAAQQKATADAKAQQLSAAQAAAKLQQEKNLLADQSVTKTEVVTSPISFTSSEKEDSSLPKGQRKTTTTGVNGEKSDTYEVTYVGGKQIAKKLIKSEVTTQPINEVVSVGTYVAPSQAATPSYVAPTQTQSPYYANCSDARAAGVTPLYQGQPGYRSGLDRDHDGVACE